MRSIQLPGLPRSCGFSLLEVIIALAILGVAVVTLMQLFSNSLRTTKNTEQYTKAIIHARSLMEEAYSFRDPTRLTQTYDLGGDFNGTVNVINISTEENTMVYEITVRVTWPPSGSVELHGLRTINEQEE